MKPCLNLQEVAEYLNCSRRTVKRLIEGGHLLAFPVRQRDLRVRWEDLQAYIEGQIKQFENKSLDE